MIEKKMHYFEFHFQKFIAATKGWKDDEVGAFVKLLIEQFDVGYIPEDPDELCRLITSYKKNWKRLSKKFTEPSATGQLRNTFMCVVRNNAHEKSEKNSENGAKGGRAKKANAIANGTANAEQSLSERGSLPVTSNQEPKKKKIKKEILPGEWDYNPGPDTEVELSEMEIGGTIEWIAALRLVDISDVRIMAFWKAFKLKLTGEKFYQNRGDLVQHFRNWIKDQDLESKQLTKNSKMVH